MDEVAETVTSKIDPKLIIWIGFCIAIYLAYRQYLKQSLRIQEAQVLAISEVFRPSVTRPVTTTRSDESQIITTMNGQVSSVPVIKDDETGAIVESTQGPTIQENKEQ